ncbi:MAG: PHP domain-containing protein [Lachnospiraceae bacterium]|nr:PHP domain-containing protein [Lachnospiraceae bacterium]
MIDLHMHSTASDGQYTPEELVKLVKNAGIELMALTDHDSIAGVEEAQQVAHQNGICCIAGIELSIRHEQELHMLGLGIDTHNERLSRFCEQLVRDRDTRADKIISYLEEFGLTVLRQEVEAKAGSNVIGRPHFAQVLLEKGYVSSIQEAFDRYLATEGFSKIERPKPSAEEGIHMIHEAGGIAVLAHPVSLKKSGADLEQEISELVKEGLDGIETYYSTHTEKQIQEYHELAKKYQLIETAGSDFHGEKIKPAIVLGHKEGGREILVDAELLLDLPRLRNLSN